VLHQEPLAAPLLLQLLYRAVTPPLSLTSSTRLDWELPVKGPACHITVRELWTVPEPHAVLLRDGLLGSGPRDVCIDLEATLYNDMDLVVIGGRIGTAMAVIGSYAQSTRKWRTRAKDGGDNEDTVLLHSWAEDIAQEMLASLQLPPVLSPPHTPASPQPLRPMPCRPATAA